jgi:hypothetical protein
MKLPNIYSNKDGIPYSVVFVSDGVRFPEWLLTSVKGAPLSYDPKPNTWVPASRAIDIQGDQVVRLRKLIWEGQFDGFAKYGASTYQLQLLLTFHSVELE